MTIMSGFAMYKSEKKKDQVQYDDVSGQITLLVVQILSGLGFLFSSTAFFVRLKHMLDEGGYDSEDLKQIRRDILIKKKQIKEKQDKLNANK